MKESSGIYQSVTDSSIHIVFGGKIGLSLRYDNEHKVLTIVQLEESFKIGEKYPEDKINKNCPSINLLFNNIDSVNEVIKHLEIIKNNLI